MPLLFKIRKTLVTLSFALILKVSILDIPKLDVSEKGYLISQNLGGTRRY